MEHLLCAGICNRSLVLAGLAFWVGEMAMSQSGGSTSYKDVTEWMLKNSWVLMVFEIWKDPK